MKKLILIFIPLFFFSCKKEEILPCICNINGINSTEYLSNDSTEYIKVFYPNSFTPNDGNYTNNYFNGIIYHHEINYEIIEMEEGLFDTISKNQYTEIPYNLFVEGNQVDNYWDGSGYSNGEYNFLITYNFNGINYQKNGKVYLINDTSNLSNSFNNVPEGLSNCTFLDMIDPIQGFIYPTNEDISNW